MSTTEADAYWPEPVPGHPSPGMHLWGWMAPAELDWLAKQAAKMATIVEVGSLHGRSSFALASACPGRVYCIDPFEGGSWESWKTSVASVLLNAIGVMGYSPSAGKLIHESIDMVFLDGAHDRDSVVADIDYWWRRTNRLLCGHDYGHEGYPDVAAVVDERFGAQVQTVEGTYLWYVWRYDD